MRKTLNNPEKRLEQTNWAKLQNAELTCKNQLTVLCINDDVLKIKLRNNFIYNNIKKEYILGIKLIKETEDMDTENILKEEIKDLNKQKDILCSCIRRQHYWGVNTI